MQTDFSLSCQFWQFLWFFARLLLLYTTGLTIVQRANAPLNNKNIDGQWSVNHGTKYILYDMTWTNIFQVPHKFHIESKKQEDTKA